MKYLILFGVLLLSFINLGFVTSVHAQTVTAPIPVYGCVNGARLSGMSCYSGSSFYPAVVINWTCPSGSTLNTSTALCVYTTTTLPPTGPAIGYATVSGFADNLGHCAPSAGTSQTPILNDSAPFQSMGGCIQSITLSSSDSVQISCGHFSNPRTFYDATPITGPGTFGQNCEMSGGLFINSGYLTVLRSTPVATSTPVTPPSLISYSYTPSTYTLVITGKSLGTQSDSSTHLDFTGSSTVSLSNSPTQKFTVTDSQIKINVSQNSIAIPGTYAVQYTNSKGQTNTLNVVLDTNASVVVVGGFLTTLSGPMSGIFDWVKNSIPPRVNLSRIALGLHSSAYSANQLRTAINSQLGAQHPVVVVAHSLGAFIAYKVSTEYTGKKVQFIYVDPPFNFMLARAGASGISQAAINYFKGNPRTMLNWTNGDAFSHFLTHDAFDYPNSGNNHANLAALKAIILQDIADSVTQQGSFGSVSRGWAGGSIITALNPKPVLTGVVDQAKNPVTSITAGQTVSIAGRFLKNNTSSPNGTYYDIQIVNTDNPTIYYDFYGFPSLDGMTIPFTLPDEYDLAELGGTSDLVTGQYNLYVAGTNTDLSNPIGITITTGTSTVSANIFSATEVGSFVLEKLENFFQRLFSF